MAVSVLGFYLGMTRQRAEVNAHKRGLRIMTDVPPTPCLRHAKSGDCDILDDHGRYIGLSVHFGSDDCISSMIIERAPPAADAGVRKVAIAKLFKGNTYALFFRYSNALRLKLLGQESSRVLPTDPRETGARFTYAKLGLTVGADPAFGPERAYEVSIVLAYPARSAPK